MPPRRRASVYTQLGIGDCGHIVSMWPLISGQVFCDECAREKYGIDATDQFILVRVRSSSLTADRLAPKKPRKAASKKAKPKKPMSAFLVLLQEEGLF